MSSGILQTHKSTASCAMKTRSGFFHHAPLPQATYPLIIPRPQSVKDQLSFALYPVMHFSERYWCRKWSKPPIPLDKYLIHFDNPHISRPTYFHPETEFMGIPYRLKIDMGKCHDLPPIVLGDTVEVYNLNGRCHRHRYVIDSCQLIRDGVAYLIVHHRYFEDQGFTTINDHRHPSFVLEVPDFFNKVPLQPHLSESSETIMVSHSHNPLLRLLQFISCPFTQQNIDPDVTDVDPTRANLWLTLFCCLDNN